VSENASSGKQAHRVFSFPAENVTSLRGRDRPSGHHTSPPFADVHLLSHAGNVVARALFSAFATRARATAASNRRLFCVGIGV
jgi:hypothetical protein